MDIDHCATLKCYAESDELGSTPRWPLGWWCHPDDLRSFHDSKAVLRVHTILQCPRLPKIKIAQFQRDGVGNVDDLKGLRWERPLLLGHCILCINIEYSCADNFLQDILKQLCNPQILQLHLLLAEIFNCCDFRLESWQLTLRDISVMTAAICHLGAGHLSNWSSQDGKPSDSAIAAFAIPLPMQHHCKCNTTANAISLQMHPRILQYQCNTIANADQNIGVPVYLQYINCNTNDG